jgi:hypothetical protein
MASGDASRTWFSEMVETLRQEWKSDLSWEQLFTLRDRLDAMLQDVRTSRRIQPPMIWCPVCKTRTRQAAPRVSVRATILAIGRFGIVAPAEMKSLEKRWANHRKENSLDRNGKPNPAVATSSDSQGPDRHSHDPTLRSQHLTSFETTPEGEAREGESVDEGFTLGANERWPR